MEKLSADSILYGGPADDTESHLRWQLELLIKDYDSADVSRNSPPQLFWSLLDEDLLPHDKHSRDFIKEMLRAFIWEIWNAHSDRVKPELHQHWLSALAYGPGIVPARDRYKELYKDMFICICRAACIR